MNKNDTYGLRIIFDGEAAKLIHAMREKKISCGGVINALVNANAEKIKKEYNLKLK